MPPKKPAPPSSRRAVAVGSHQILFSAPLDGAEEPRGRAAGGGRVRRDRSSSTAARKTAVADYSHVQSKVRSQMGTTGGSSGPPPLPSATMNALGAYPPAPPPPPFQQQPQQQPVYEVLPADAPPPVLGSGGAAAGNTTRISRLLRNARATVPAPLRPETPLELFNAPATDRSREAFLKGPGRRGGAAVRRARFGLGDTAGAAAVAPAAAAGRGRLAALGPIPTTATADAAGGSSSSPVDPFSLSFERHRTAAAAMAPSDAGSARSTPPPQQLQQHSSGGSPSLALSSSSSSFTTPAAVPAVNPETFLDALRRAERQSRQQVALLRSLGRWLSNPQHTIHPEWMAYFRDFLSRCNRAGSSDEDGGGGDVVVAVVLASVLLHNCTMQGNDGVPLAELALLLREITSPPSSSSSPAAAASPLSPSESALEIGHHRAVLRWLGQELVFEPLLHMVASEELLATEPRAVADALEALGNCSYGDAADAVSSSPHGGGGGTAASPHVQHLVTLGAIPTLNTFTMRLLALMEDLAGVRSFGEDGANGGTTLAALLPDLLRSVCLLYRNLATHFSHHLLKLGTLSILLSVLDAARGSTPVVAAVARTLAKLAFDDSCLAEFQKDTRTLRMSLAALSTQLSLPSSSSSSSATASTAACGDVAVALIVSRLCSVMAQLTEGCPAQHEYLTQHGTDVQLAILRRFVTPAVAAAASSSSSASAAAAAAGKSSRSQQQPLDGSLRSAATLDVEAAAEDMSLTVVQGAVWLVGVTAMGAGCPLGFVEEAATSLTAFLAALRPDSSPAARLAAVYTLMCLSNLSFYFPAIERRNDSGAFFLAELYNSLGLVAARVLVDGDVEATVEATRVLGNMSFTNAGRDWMEANKCDEVVVLFLGHEDLRVVYNCFGVVLNLTAATTCRVVEDAELLSMMLRYTARFTSRRSIDAAAAMDTQAVVAGDADVAKDYAEQVADLVEKCLSNVKGLLETTKQQQQQQQQQQEEYQRPSTRREVSTSTDI